mgnify:CR=1 FL=1
MLSMELFQTLPFLLLLLLLLLVFILVLLPPQLLESTLSRQPLAARAAGAAHSVGMATGAGCTGAGGAAKRAKHILELGFTARPKQTEKKRRRNEWNAGDTSWRAQWR